MKRRELELCEEDTRQQRRPNLTFRLIVSNGWRFLGRWSSPNETDVEAMWERLPRGLQQGPYAVDFCDGAGNVLVIKFVDAHTVESILGATVEVLLRRTVDLIRETHQAARTGLPQLVT